MGVGKQMKTFFAAMNEQIGMGGYDSKIKNTPLGPFKWNDLTQLWENVNNGMVMNNVSFQDMFIMNYESAGGDNGTANTGLILIPSDWGNLQVMDAVNQIYYASSSGAQINSANATTVQFTNLAASITVSLSFFATFGNTPSIQYIKNSESIAIYTTPITINNNDTLKIAAGTPNLVGGGVGAGTIRVTNVTTSTILDDIPYSYNIEG